MRAAIGWCVFPMDLKKKAGFVVAVVLTTKRKAFDIEKMTNKTTGTLKLKDASLFKTEGFINGQWVKDANGATFPVKGKSHVGEISTCQLTGLLGLDPSTGMPFCQVADLGKEHTENAIAAAKAAFPKWRGLDAKVRR